MKEVELTNSNLKALVDNPDYERVLKVKWRLAPSHRTNYAVTGAGVEPYNNLQFLHNFILACPAGYVWDHEDKNGLNCQRFNLRLATNSQNKANGERYSNNTSGYKGVTFRKERGTWRAQIRVDNRLQIIGTFKCIHDAAEAYNKRATREFKEFACLNVIERPGQIQ